MQAISFSDSSGTRETELLEHTLIGELGKYCMGRVTPHGEETRSCWPVHFLVANLTFSKTFVLKKMQVKIKRSKIFNGYTSILILLKFSVFSISHLISLKYLSLGFGDTQFFSISQKLPSFSLIYFCWTLSLCLLAKCWHLPPLSSTLIDTLYLSNFAHFHYFSCNVYAIFVTPDKFPCKVVISIYPNTNWPPSFRYLMDTFPHVPFTTAKALESTGLSQW